MCSVYTYENINLIKIFILYINFARNRISRKSSTRALYTHTRPQTNYVYITEISINNNTMSGLIFLLIIVNVGNRTRVK